MSIPNDFPVITAVYASGDYDLKTHSGQAAFVDAAVRALHTANAKWGHLKKNPGQTNVHGHAEDAALYKLPDNQAQAVDFIAGAGGPNPKPYWNVDSNGPIYTHADWLDPADHDGPPAPPPPQYPPYPQPEDQVDGAGVFLFSDFAQAGQAPNPQMFRFAFRVAYSWLTKEVPDLPASVAKHRQEWRALLGLPPLR
jgi:hypothetical protein